MDLKIKGFLETSFLDWDGHIVSTVYLPGCNFHCPFCSNSGLVDDPDQYLDIPPEKVFAHLKKHPDFIDGVCITGGEPSLHKEKGLIGFIAKVKSLGLKIKFVTNGYDPELLQKLIQEKLVDYIAMDVKAPLNEKYNELAGVKVDLAKIRQSIELIINSGLDHEFRTTVVAHLLDKQDIESIAQSISRANKYVLQQFEPKYAHHEDMRDSKPYSKEEMAQMLTAAKKHISNTILRGI